MKQLIIFNPKLEVIGIIDLFRMLIWTRKFYTNGTFQLLCDLTEDNLNMLKKDNIIYKSHGEAAYIEGREITVNEAGIEQLKITGKFLTAYMSRRIMHGTTIFNGKAEELTRKLVNENMINPQNIHRKFEFLELGELNGYSEKIQYQKSYGNIMEQNELILAPLKIGFCINMDNKKRKLIYNTKKGIDRTVNQLEVPKVVFSRDFENILEQKFIDSRSDYYNSALIAGAGEGEERKTIEIEDTTKTGANRYELFVDARDIQDQITENNETIKIPDETYYPLLIERGNQYLAQHAEIYTLDSKINTNANLKYRTDYDIGDFVTVVDKKWKIKMDTQITEIEETYEETGQSINIVFGNSIIDIIEKIKRKG